MKKKEQAVSCLSGIILRTNKKKKKVTLNDSAGLGQSLNVSRWICLDVFTVTVAEIISKMMVAHWHRHKVNQL